MKTENLEPASNHDGSPPSSSATWLGHGIQHEGYPKGWTRVVLMISPKGNEAHAIGGDRAPGNGDSIYYGYEHVKNWLKSYAKTEELKDVLREIHHDAQSLCGAQERARMVLDKPDDIKVPLGQRRENLAWWRKDKTGWPIETFAGKPIKSALRIACQNLRKLVP